MDKHVVSVLLALILYAVYVLLPIIPAYLLYKAFPTDKIMASGVFSKFSFNATGAFAGYVITVFLGYYLVNKIHIQIAHIANPTWTVKSDFKLVDPTGKEIRDTKLYETLVVTIHPELSSINGNKVMLQLPGDKSFWGKTKLTFVIPQFGSNTKYLNEVSKKAEIDEYNLIIDSKEPITISADESYLRPYTAGKTSAPVAGGPPLQAGLTTSQEGGQQ